MSLTPAKPKPNSIHHKRRYGQHQKHTKRFKDTYWPYLPMLAIVAVGLVTSAIWSGTARGVLGATTNINVSTLLSDTNIERSQDNEHGLQLNSQLTAAAQAKADDMAARNYWSHVTPDGKQPWTFIQNTGYQYEAAGENLAYGFSSANATMRGWMSSAEHRNNILNSAYHDVGFGIATSPDYQGHGQQTVIVALYAEPVAVTTASADTSHRTASFASTDAPSQQIARAQVLSSQPQPWVLFVVVAAAAFAAGIFVVRHALFWHRALVRSEAFVIKHHMLDLLFVSIAILGIIFTRTAGFIH